MKKPKKTKTSNPIDYASVSLCKLCPNLGTNHVPSAGSPSARVMIVGQSPGVNEAIRKQPFVGPCGDYIDFMLDEAELTRDEVYIANALKCHPPGNRKALPGELANCWRTWLHPEIKLVSPKIILVLGADAHKSILPPNKPFEHLAEYESKNHVFLVSYHPSWFLRHHDLEGFVKVGRKLKDLLND